MNEKIALLDFGFVRLVDKMGNDESVVRAARVSYNAAWRAGEDEGSDARLIRYLWKNKHTTPFESVQFTFEVKAPIFVFRQWHRHRTWSFNELSARYRELPEEFYLPRPQDIGVQSKASKQARDIGDVDDVELRKRGNQIAAARAAMQASFDAYRKLLADGWPKELARSVLPVATYSHMFASVNLLNLLKFLTLRCHVHAQMEIRVYAEAMRELIRPIVPVSVAAWEGGGMSGMRVIHIDFAKEFKPGDQPPSGYADKHDWAEVQGKAGLKQRKCWFCGKWRFPQEVCHGEKPE